MDTDDHRPRKTWISRCKRVLAPSNQGSHWRTGKDHFSKLFATGWYKQWVTDLSPQTSSSPGHEYQPSLSDRRSQKRGAFQKNKRDKSTGSPIGKQSITSKLDKSSTAWLVPLLWSWSIPKDTRCQPFWLMTTDAGWTLHYQRCSLHTRLHGTLRTPAVHTRHG